MVRMAGLTLRRFPILKTFCDEEDIVQNAVIRLLRAMESSTPQSENHLQALIFTEIRREILDQARKAHRREPMGATVGSITPKDSSWEINLDDPNTEDPDQIEEWSAFHSRLESLPTTLREALSLSYYHQWPQSRIAELFHVDERTVRRWIRHACATLGKTFLASHARD